MKSHPPNPANETMNGTFKKMAMGFAIKVGGKKESRKTPIVIKREARQEKIMGLTDFRIFFILRRNL
jgi:hypothetical protein